MKALWKSVAKWPVFLLANLTLLLVIGVSTVRETYRGWTVDREIQALENEATSLEGRKTQMERLAQELVSQDRVEFEARARLGKQKPGERVIVLEGFDKQAAATDEAFGTELFEKPARDERTNPERWWSYFFHP